jgi:hypothetical protein
VINLRNKEFSNQTYEVDAQSAKLAPGSTNGKIGQILALQG